MNKMYIITNNVQNLHMMENAIGCLSLLRNYHIYLLICIDVELLGLTDMDNFIRSVQHRLR